MRLRTLRRSLLGLLAAIVLLASPASFLHADQRDLSPTPRTPAPALPITGDYWALIIGIDRYQHAPKLRSAVKDATGVRDVLVSRYGFAPERVISLLDKQATRTNIEQELYRLGQLAKPDDSVLIYYAGHGQYDDEGRLGWWVPVEGQPNQPGTFITNASIRDYIAGMKARHVYLVADSCFSGTLFGQRATMPVNDKTLAKLAAKRSRWGLTSGGTEPVADEGRSGHSVFAYHFITLLRENTEPYLVPSRIYAELLPLVGNNTDQTPRSEPLKGAGDEGGQFVFRLVSAASGPVPKPSMPSAPALSAPASERVELSRDEQYESLAMIALQREKAWVRVKSWASETRIPHDVRIAELVLFLAEFPENNPHKEEAQALMRQVEHEWKVAKAPAYEAPLDAGREITGKDGAPMVLVPAGEFVMGSPKGEGDENEHPRHRVYLDSFFIDKFEVAHTQYRQFIKATGHRPPPHWGKVDFESDEVKWPVFLVSWGDAKAYCEWAGKRLPTEAEWEKAARGTDGRKYPWGNEPPGSSEQRPASGGTVAIFGPVSGIANVGTGFTGNGVKPVGSFPQDQSPYGIFDLGGNVGEWVNDWYDSTYYERSAEQNPSGPSSPGEAHAKVIRGGYWNGEVGGARATARHFWELGKGDKATGFRCAQDVPK